MINNLHDSRFTQDSRVTICFNTKPCRNRNNELFIILNFSNNNFTHVRVCVQQRLWTYLPSKSYSVINIRGRVHATKINAETGIMAAIVGQWILNNLVSNVWPASRTKVSSNNIRTVKSKKKKCFVKVYGRVLHPKSKGINDGLARNSKNTSYGRVGWMAKTIR